MFNCPPSQLVSIELALMSNDKKMILGIAGLILQIFFYSPKPEGNELWVHTKFNHLLKAHFSPLSCLSRQLSKKKKNRGHFCSSDEFIDKVEEAE